ncbi:hypothetical protein MMC18_007915 [Xylographa bjoerkii]|nr:hypothetical protein [Xylographa bjoerkii]
MIVGRSASKCPLQPSLATLPPEIHYNIVKYLTSLEHFCLSLTCRTLFQICPGIEAIEYYDQFNLLLMWEKDGFFQGLACADCNKFHQTKYFDVVNRVMGDLASRNCIGITGIIDLHPKWSINYWDFREVVQMLKARHLRNHDGMDRDNEPQEMKFEQRQLDFPDQVTENLEDMEDTESMWDSDGIETGVTISDMFSSEVLGSELQWCESCIDNIQDRTAKDLRMLQTFSAIKRVALRSRFESTHQHELVIDDIDAWISRVQFFCLDDGTVQAILVWILNLDCLKFPRPPTREDMAKELDEKDLCINLCPHIKMNDERVLATRFNVQMSEESQGRILSSDGFQCSRCLTRIKVQIRKPRLALITTLDGDRQYINAKVPCLAVAIVRNFGKLQSATDPAWFNQLHMEENVCSEALADRASYRGNWQDNPSHYCYRRRYV